MNSILNLCLAINIFYGQIAAPQPHPDAWFGIDKIKHFFISAFIESLSYSALQAARVHHPAAMTGAIGITIGFGVGREIHDQRTPGNIGTGAGAALLSHTIR